MQVSVPGIYKNPAPYREQILTYSTALALTGRSAACAPLKATRPAAEPRIRLLIIVILNLQVALPGQGRTYRCSPRKGPPSPCENRSVVSRLRTHPHQREGLKRTTKTERSRTPPTVFRTMHVQLS